MKKYILFFSTVALIVTTVVLTTCDDREKEVRVATKTTAPAAPGNIVATAGNTKVTLSWTTPNNGGSMITKYQVSYGATAGYTADWKDITGSGASTKAHTVSELINGTDYTFEVRAVNAKGHGASSGIKTATPDAPEETPTDVTFTAVQTGGTSGTANSTGIVLTFSQAVTGLTADRITIEKGTGEVTKGALTGAYATWTIALTSVITEGDVKLSVSNFGKFNVTTTPKTVAVYKRAVNEPFVSVADISGVPDTQIAGTPLTLSSTVNPSAATNKIITWSIVSSLPANIASISGNSLNTTATGTVTLRATIANGKASGTPYTQDFTVTVFGPLYSSINKAKMLELVNKHRTTGCNCGGTTGKMAPTTPVVWNNTLELVAYDHSYDMRTNNFFSHTSSDGSTFTQRLTRRGYSSYRTAGENIAGGYSTEELVVNGWITSEGHCKNIMNPDFKEIGVSMVKGGSLNYYWTMMLASKPDFCSIFAIIFF